jgi:hypothetical protein
MAERQAEPTLKKASLAVNLTMLIDAKNLK